MRKLSYILISKVSPSFINISNLLLYEIFFVLNVVLNIFYIPKYIKWNMVDGILGNPATDQLSMQLNVVKLGEVWITMRQIFYACLIHT